MGVPGLARADSVGLRRVAAQERDHPLHDLRVLVKIVVGAAFEDEQLLGLGRGREQGPAIAGRHGLVARTVNLQHGSSNSTELALETGFDGFKSKLDRGGMFDALASLCSKKIDFKAWR